MGANVGLIRIVGVGRKTIEGCRVVRTLAIASTAADHAEAAAPVRLG